jgi:nucleoside-diphosphate-sugar epimerase
MKILITGSEGNIGSKLVPYLKSKGHLIHRCDIIQATGNDYSVVNINSPGDLNLVFDRFRPEVVYHLAAMVSRVTCENSPGLTIETNLSGFYNVIQLCERYQSRLIYFSTSEVYGNIGGILKEDREDLEPNNIYGLSKLLGEKLVKYEIGKGLNAIIVRPFMFYDEDETLGEHRSAMIRFAENLIRGNKINIHRNSSRSWMHISDAIAILERLLYNRGFHVINIGSEHTILMTDLARMMCDCLNLNYENMIREIELPDRMTLTKYPDCNLQWELTNYISRIKIEEGIKLVINKVKARIR